MGIASHLDSTGNILVDVADGIGLVSKGIEALENWVDPNSQPKEDIQPDAPSIDPNVPQITPVPAQAPPTEVPKPVICKKGKCAPYDPSKDRVLQQQLIKAERDRILQQIQSGALPAETAKQLAEELEELDEDGALSRKMKSVPKPSVTPVPSTKPAKSGGDFTVEILNPVDPQIPSSKDISSSTSETVEESPVVGTQVSGWRYGAKRILGSFASVCQRLNQLLLKVVAKVFPWNRRARRRLNGGSEDE